MLNAISLASGSFGNCLLIFSAKTKILVDVGISMLDMRRKLDKLTVDPKLINGIFITHEHNDHARGAEKLSSTYNIPVYCNKMTSLRLNTDKTANIRFNIFETGSTINLRDLCVNSFKTFHDSIEPVGYSIRHKEYKITYMVDTCRFTNENSKEIEDANLVIIDSNYDHMSLLKGSYPYPVKQRIMGTGHLSNEIVANAIRSHPNLKETEFWLAHLSENNNMPHLASKTMNHILKDSGCNVRYKILPRKEIGPLWTAGNPASNAPRHSAADGLEQMCLEF